MNQRIALVQNSNAGKGKSQSVANQLSVWLKKKDIQHDFFLDNWPVDFFQFTEVWIIGGDGTLNYFINRYPLINLPLVIFKGGTGNDFAWKLYGNMPLYQQFEWVLNCSPKSVDAGLCNGLLFLNTIGIGFDGEVVQSMKTIRFLGGNIGYYFIILKKILLFKEASFRIYSEDLLGDGKFLLVSIANSSRTGGRFHISPKSSLNDGLLDLVLVKPLSILKRIFYLPKIEKGDHLDLPFVRHVAAEQFKVVCERELPAHLDGELIMGKQFDITIIKNKYLFRYG